ncbi:MAG: DEAD/DEAH box helicase [Nanoarchaeota archaeon]|nr:DEAD/DEAH box helicase [Nanoarchaeota archaeon]
MIEFQTEEYPEEQILAELNPLVREWFTKKFKTFSPPQRFSIVNIRHRQSTLISSPTGSGKTLSAFLSILNELINLAEKDLLEDRIYCVYISPLKALARDIERNLREPLKEIAALHKEKTGNDKLGIRVGVRTGDTTPYQRAGMLKKPPHIFITTPESLSIVLSTQKFSEHLKEVEWMIIDEIHALADSKRGVHLSLALERLEQLSQPCRIGLSATVCPLDEVAKFLVGMEEPYSKKPRPCKIVDVQFLKELDLKVVSPVKSLITTDYHTTNTKTYELLDRLIQDHRTTLVFTNTRSGTERVVHHLKDRFPKHYTGVDVGENDDLADVEKEKKKIDEMASKPVPKVPINAKQEVQPTPGYVGAHHGSLSKELRVDIENRLKSGDLKAVVSSTSLELGIDIGYIDLVILLGSPKSVARGLQRIGRSGHQLHEKSKGRIIVLDRDDLVECSVLLKAAIEKKIDNIRIPMGCLDVLAQQIVGIVVSAEEPMNIDDLFGLIKNSYCYHEIEYKDFMNIIHYLAGNYAGLEERSVYGKIWYDEDTQRVGKRGKLARVLYMTNVGTIPEETNVKVKLWRGGSEGYRIGTISEPFLEKLHRGDVFVLGGQTYEFIRAQGLTAWVKGSAGRAPTVPSWFSEMLPLSYELAMEIQKFRRYVNEYFESSAKKEEIMDFLRSYLYVDENSANSIYDYFREQFLYTKIPHDKKIIIEHIHDRGKKYHIYHTLYGRRVNDVLSRAVGFAASKMIKRDVELGINDNGFYIASTKPIQARRALTVLNSQELRQVLEISLEKSEVLSRRFRHCAARALMILRSYKGNRKSVGRQQMSSRLLINTIRKISPDFPILKEAKREVLEDSMDIKNALRVIRGIETGMINVEEVFTEIPSPFAFNLVAQGYTDIMKMEDKYEFLKRMHDMVMLKIDLQEQRKNK